MITDLPSYIAWSFVLTTLLTLILFANSIRKSYNASTRKKILPIVIIALAWLGIQALLTLKGLYNSNTNSFPPNLLVFGMFPVVITIIIMLVSTNGKRFVDSLPLRYITWINIVRIPVELVLFWLFMNKAIPEIITFEGRNFDILSGISAPLVVLIAFRKGNIKTSLLLIWNILCLGLLLNIVVNAMLSAPFSFQKFAFDQPNIAIINFPFSWLPTFIAPIILLGHLVSIRQLLSNKK